MDIGSESDGCCIGSQGIFNPGGGGGRTYCFQEKGIDVVQFILPNLKLSISPLAQSNHQPVRNL
eukprot:6702302-Pyramimonas_sp.AAC.1